MTKRRLDQAMAQQGLTTSRSQAESYIKLGKVSVNSRPVTKPGAMVHPDDSISLQVDEQYVSRAALKLASVASALQLDFRDKIVLDVGSSTGGFTQYALLHGAQQVIAVDVGSNQLHPTLRSHDKIELHEQTDIRELTSLSRSPDLVLADVSFISLRDILPHLATICGPDTRFAVMVKPQFEAASSAVKHNGVIKNDAMRRKILKDFEIWLHSRFVLLSKADSSVHGAKGNQERFYLLKR